MVDGTSEVVVVPCVLWKTNQCFATDSPRKNSPTLVTVLDGPDCSSNLLFSRRLLPPAEAGTEAAARQAARARTRVVVRRGCIGVGLLERTFEGSATAFPAEGGRGPAVAAPTDRAEFRVCAENGLDILSCRFILS
jgi:hypothetical protein